MKWICFLTHCINTAQNIKHISMCFYLEQKKFSSYEIWTCQVSSLRVCLISCKHFDVPSLQTHEKREWEWEWERKWSKIESEKYFDYIYYMCVFSLHFSLSNSIEISLLFLSCSPAISNIILHNKNLSFSYYSSFKSEPKHFNL